MGKKTSNNRKTAKRRGSKATKPAKRSRAAEARKARKATATKTSKPTRAAKTANMGSTIVTRRRDDFSMPVLRLISQEVRLECSNPDCRGPTHGPSRQKGISNVGVGAHITAAAPGGPRYDATLTANERRSEANAIWLCNTCGRLVDNDTSTYTVPQLVQWKRDAIDRAQKALASGGRSTTQVLFAAHDVLEAPGLHEISKVAFTFLRPNGWDRVRAGLEALTSYAAEGTPKQKVAVLEALTRLAIYTRQQMPDDILMGMLSVSEEATLHGHNEAPEFFDEGFDHAVEVAGHVGYDATLYVRHGFGAFTSARLLSQLLHQAQLAQREDLCEIVLEQFEMCIDAAGRAHPEPWLDASRWYQYKRDHPGRGHQVPPPELNEVEARLLGVHR